MENVATLVATHSESADYDESCIGVKLNEKDTQKSHWNQNPIRSHGDRLRETSNTIMLPHC